MRDENMNMKTSTLEQFHMRTTSNGDGQYLKSSYLPELVWHLQRTAAVGPQAEKHRTGRTLSLRRNCCQPWRLHSAEPKPGPATTTKTTATATFCQCVSCFA